ncbi:MAG: ribonuclease [Acidobacteria bacterium]|jgi:ribonuclease HII|nr:ribonuclease [Acidobacteriota bacterium]
MWSHDYFEKTLRSNGFRLIAGVDEVGRGALAGPVLAAAVVLDGKEDYTTFRDSKILSAGRRRILAQRIQAEALGVGFGWISESEIDRINILQATYKAMLQAVANLPTPPDMVLVDGFFLHGLEMPCIGIVGGDSRSYSIAAASIVAKVSRDALMLALASGYPQYGFDRNKGYGTDFHRRAILQYGPSPCHRRTFQGVRAAGGNDGQ